MKRFEVLTVVLTLSCGVAFSEENQTLSTKIEQNKFFDSISPRMTVSQRDSLLVSDGQEEARSSTTLYNVGATITKGDFSLSGDYYLFREEGFIPQENNFFRPEVWLSYSAFSDYGLSLSLDTGYFPTYNKQDDFTSAAANLGYRYEFSDSFTISSSARFRADFDRAIDYENEDEDLVITKDSPAYHLVGSVRMTYKPIDKVSLFTGANCARIFEESYVYETSNSLAVTSKKAVSLEKRENLTSTWMYSFLRAGASYDITDSLSVTDQVFVFMTDGFRDLQEGQILQNRISLTYAY